MAKPETSNDCQYPQSLGRVLVSTSKGRVLSGTATEQAQLIQAIARGEQSALARLYDATCAQVYGLVLYILKDQSLAEEITLDVYLQVWHEADSYSAQRGAPMAWLMLLARSRAIDRLRALRKERAHRSSESPEEDRMAIDLLSNNHVVNAESALGVRSAFQQLSPEQRQALYLAYFKGMSHREIAEYLSLPLGTIKTHIRIGMLHLRELLAGFSEDER